MPTPPGRPGSVGGASAHGRVLWKYRPRGRCWMCSWPLAEPRAPSPEGHGVSLEEASGLDAVQLGAGTFSRVLDFYQKLEFCHWQRMLSALLRGRLASSCPLERVAASLPSEEPAHLPVCRRAAEVAAKEERPRSCWLWALVGLLAAQLRRSTPHWHRPLARCSATGGSQLSCRCCEACWPLCLLGPGRVPRVPRNPHAKRQEQPQTEASRMPQTVQRVLGTGPHSGTVGTAAASVCIDKAQQEWLHRSPRVPFPASQHPGAGVVLDAPCVHSLSQCHTSAGRSQRRWEAQRPASPARTLQSPGLLRGRRVGRGQHPAVREECLQGTDHRAASGSGI